MGKIIAGGFNGTGATLYICCGFLPDFVTVWNLDDPEEHLVWSKYRSEAGNVEGITWEVGAAPAIVELTAGAGVRQFYGGDVLTSSDVGTTTYGEGVYLKHRPRDYRYGVDKASYGSGGALSDTIDTWTLDTSGSRSGHFNEDVDATGLYIGEGSPICIDGRWYIIESVSASAGEAADEVVLNYAAPSGQVQYIGGKYGEWVPMIAGEAARDGFVLARTTDINVNNERCYFEAGCYDI